MSPSRRQPPRLTLLAAVLVTLSAAVFAVAWTRGSESVRALLVASLASVLALCAAALLGARRGRKRADRLERERAIARYLSHARADQAGAHTRVLEDRSQPAAVPQPPSPPAREAPEPPAPAKREPAPARQPVPEPGPATSRFDFPAFARALCDSPDAIGSLKAFVGDVRTRQAQTAPSLEALRASARGDGRLTALLESVAAEAWRRANFNEPASAANPDDVLPPCDAEIWLANQLEEAGLFAQDVELPPIQAIRPRNSHMIYLRALAPSLSWRAFTRIVEVEAALNRVRLASTYFDAPSEAPLVDLMVFAQRFESSVCGQWREVASLALEANPRRSMDRGEWAFREAFSTAVETVQLPYRLTCAFRANLEGGAVAVEVDLTPPEAFPKTVCSFELERLVATTVHMREMVASAYAARVALLLAAVAFACSPKVRTVSVAGVSNNGTSHTCYYSVEFDRLRFLLLDLSDVPDPLAILRSFGAAVDERGGVLQPVDQLFVLEDERFCPKRRYEAPALSSRELEPSQARAFGCDSVAGLEINEDVWRRRVADSFVRDLAGSVSDKVGTILNATRDAGAPIAEAGRRTATKLISGEIDDENLLAVEEEFVSGDSLSRAVERVLPLMGDERPSEAARILAQALDAADADGRYADEPGVSRRYFNSYVERVLYNRAFAEEGARVELVPDAYFNAHLLLSSALYDAGDERGALKHAERAHELDPLDERAILRIVRCHESAGELDRAVDALNALLRNAHTNESLGVAYYRMAFMQHLLGNAACSQACYRKSLDHASSCSAMAFMELLSIHGPEALQMASSEVKSELERGGVAVAPTGFVSRALADGARAATDAEVFPVARNFAQAYGALEGNDVLFGVIKSIEHEPDR